MAKKRRRAKNAALVLIYDPQEQEAFVEAVETFVKTVQELREELRLLKEVLKASTRTVPDTIPEAFK